MQPEKKIRVRKSSREITRNMRFIGVNSCYSLLSLAVGLEVGDSIKKRLL
jgi:hypothetical protein